jgi:ATP phosphoribosyltransferase regulatory subunit
MEDRPQTAIKPSRLSSASDVIDALGGTNAVAELLDIGASSVSNYRKQGFPARSHFILAKICNERGLDVADAVFGGYHVKTKKAPYQAAPVQRADALTSLEKAGFSPLSLPILQPAAPFIDRMGPEMQRRLFTFTDPGGEQLCLRPDLTIPTALAHIASGQSGEARYCYYGTAFRYQSRGSGQPEEFTQLGLEIIGGASGEADGLADDLEVLTTIIALLGEAGLKDNLRFNFADFDMLAHFLEELGLNAAARETVWRLVGLADNAEDFKRLAQLKNTRTMSQKDAEKKIDADALIVGRAGSEILARIARKDSEMLDDENVTEIFNFLSALATPNGIEQITTAFPNMKLWFDKRVNQLADAVLSNVTGAAKLQDIRFAPSISRGMAYYTGLSFEIYAGGVERPIAAGGRYDDLLHSLGATEPLSAVGGAIALERLTRIVEAQK